MLLFLSLVAVLIGIWAFSTTPIWARSLRRSVKRSVPNRQVSLWTLVLFLFFPPISMSEPK